MSRESDQQRSLFKSLVAHIQTPSRKLAGVAGYRAWAQAALSHAREADCHTILEGQDVTAQLGGGYMLQRDKNDWLYEYLLSSLSEDLAPSLDVPLQGSAHALWKELERQFCRPKEEERLSILEKITLCCARPAAKADEHSAEAKEWRADLNFLGFPLDEWVLTVWPACFSLPRFWRHSTRS
jgi:hypothetical protein